MEVEINYETCTLEKKKYSNGRIAIVANDMYSMQYATVTTNLVEEEIEDDEAFINTNLSFDTVNILKSAGVIQGNPIREVRSGFVIYPLYKINL